MGDDLRHLLDIIFALPRKRQPIYDEAPPGVAWPSPVNSFSMSSDIAWCLGHERQHTPFRSSPIQTWPRVFQSLPSDRHDALSFLEAEAEQ